MKKICKNYLPFIILGALLYTPIFAFLDTLPIRIWDEARLAINAYEMLKNHDYIVTYVDGNPDMWNTKPPLVIWAQVFFMKLIGVNELAVRLPSAIAALLTCLTLLYFSHRYLKNIWFGIITVLVLITTQGYIALHASRTGDYDVPLALFTTLSLLSFFAYCETTKNKHLYFFFGFTALAVLTKSVAGLLFLPAMLIYSIIQKQFIPLLKNKHFYFSLSTFLVIVLGYYFLREANNPGYLAAVAENELGGRYIEGQQDHVHGFWFYFDQIIDSDYSAWYLLLPCGLFLGLVSKDRKINRITLFTFLNALVFFIVISLAKTKIEWYDVPLYPLFAILVAVFIYFIFDFLRNNKWINHSLRFNITPFLFLFLIFIIPYQRIMDKTYTPKDTKNAKAFYEIGYYLKDAVKGKYNLNHQYLLYKGYNLHNKFYLHMLTEKGIEISFKYWEDLEKEDEVIAFQHDIKKYVEENYVHEKIKTVGNVVTYKTLGRKNE